MFAATRASGRQAGAGTAASRRAEPGRHRRTRSLTPRGCRRRGTGLPRARLRSRRSAHGCAHPDRRRTLRAVPCHVAAQGSEQEDGRSGGEATWSRYRIMRRARRARCVRKRTSRSLRVRLRRGHTTTSMAASSLATRCLSAVRSSFICTCSTAPPSRPNYRTAAGRRPAPASLLCQTVVSVPLAAGNDLETSAGPCPPAMVRPQGGIGSRRPPPCPEPRSLRRYS